MNNIPVIELFFAIQFINKGIYTKPLYALFSIAFLIISPLIHCFLKTIFKIVVDDSL